MPAAHLGPPPLPIVDQDNRPEVFPVSPDLNGSPPPLTAGEPASIGNLETPQVTDLTPNIKLNSRLTEQQLDELTYDPDVRKNTPGAFEEVPVSVCLKQPGPSSFSVNVFGKESDAK